jgi:hypothetical protein
MKPVDEYTDLLKVAYAVGNQHAQDATIGGFVVDAGRSSCAPMPEACTPQRRPPDCQCHSTLGAFAIPQLCAKRGGHINDGAHFYTMSKEASDQWRREFYRNNPNLAEAPINLDLPKVTPQ